MSILDRITEITASSKGDEIIKICDAIIAEYADDFREQLGKLLKKKKTDREAIVETVLQSRNMADGRAEHFKVSTLDRKKADEQLRSVYVRIITTLIQKGKLKNPTGKEVEAKALSRAHHQCLISIHAIRSTFSDEFDITSDDSIADFLTTLNEDDPPPVKAHLDIPQEQRSDTPPPTPSPKTPPPEST
jgi:hypothetical protein